MLERSWRVIVLLVVGSCSIDLDVAGEATIVCESDSQCPSTMRCSLTIGACVAEVGNQAPSLTLASIGRGVERSDIEVTLFDGESNDVELAASVVLDNQRLPLALPASTFTAAPDGEVHTLSLDVAALLGSTGYRDGLRVELTPRDKYAIGATVLSEEFEVGNDPPLVDSVALRGDGGVLEVLLDASDSSADDVEVIAFEYSSDNFATVTDVPLEVDSFGSLASLRDIATTGGLPHTLAWNTAAHAALPTTTIRVRLRLRDAWGAESGWGSSSEVPLDNAPGLALGLEPSDLRRLVEVAFVASVEDPNVPASETVGLSFTYTIDPPGGPQTFWPVAQIGTPLTSLNSLGAVPLVWDTLAEAQVAGHLLFRDVFGSDAEAAPRRILRFVEHLELRGVATDSAGLNSPLASLVVGPVGNDPPIASIVGIGADPRNNVAISVRLQDSSGDPADLEVRFREPGDAEFRVAALVLSNVTDLATSPAGVTHLVLWASDTPPPEPANPNDPPDPTEPQGVGAILATDVELQVRALDRAGASATGGAETFLGEWSASTTLPEVRNQSAPRVDAFRFDRLIDSDGSAPVVIRYRVIDDEYDPVDVRFELSIDGGPYGPCPQYPSSLGEGTTRLSSGPAPGVEHVFIWNPTADRVTRHDSIGLRVTARDGIHPDSSESERLLPRSAQSSFAAPNDVRYVETPSAVELGNGANGMFMAGDVTGDGIVDVVTAEDTGPTLQVHIGQGVDGVGSGYLVLDDGQWHCAAQVVIPSDCVGPTPRSAELVDLTGDGHLDVLLANVDATLTLMVGTGSAGLTNDSFVIPGEAYSLPPIVAPLNTSVSRDLAGDAATDVAVGTDDGVVAVYIGAPTGASAPSYGFTLAASLDVGTYVGRLIATPIDDDAALDFLAVNTLESEVVIVLNDLGATAPALSLGGVLEFPFESYPQSVATLEINGDGVLDLAVACVGQIYTFIGSRSPPYFNAEQILDGPVYLPALQMSDFNADGLDDLLATEDYLGSALGAVSVYFGRGEGLAPPEPIKTGYDRALALVAGYLNGDDLPDIAFLKHDHVNFSIERTVHTLLSSRDLIGPLPWFSPERLIEIQPDLAYSEHLLRAADFNGDGIVDLAYSALNPYPDTTGVSVMLGEGVGGLGSGTFAPAAVSFAGMGASRFETADLDGDGRSDLVLIRGTDLVVALSTGSPVFSATSTFALGTPPNQLLLADVSGDGITDILYSSSAETGFRVMYGNGSAGVGDGTFAPVETIASAARPQATVLGDFNGDAITDILFRGVTGPPWAPVTATYLLPGESLGGFGAATSVASATLWFHAQAVDLNRDGILDLVSSVGDFGSGGEITVHLGQGTDGIADGTFAPADLYAGLPGSVTPGPVFVVDVDLDGVLDLVGFSADKHEIIWFRGEVAGGMPTGSFATTHDVLLVATGLDPTGLVVRDFNGDDIPDWAVSYAKTNVISRWFGQQQRHQAFAQAVRDSTSARARTFGDDVVEPDAGIFGDQLSSKGVVLRPVYTAAHALHPDFWNAMRRSGVALPAELSPITEPWTVDGFRGVRRVEAPPAVASLGARLRIIERFGPLLPGDVVERAGLDLAAQRGIIVALPLNGRFNQGTLKSAIDDGKVWVVKESHRLRTSDEVAADPLDDPTLLPRADDGQGGTYDRIAYERTWRTVSMHDDPSFSAGTVSGERFRVELFPLGVRTMALTDIAQGQVLVLLEEPGTLQAFVED